MVAVSSTKKKRVSKRNKTSWRKHVNITDVEEFLEDKRLEERLGPPLETLKDDELFRIDTNTPQQLPSKKLKRLKLLESPRCFSILQPHTKVPDPIKKRNKVRSKEERKNELIKKKEAERRAKGILRHRELQSLEDREKKAKQREDAPKRGEFKQDIWGADDRKIAEDNWFSDKIVNHNSALLGVNKFASKTTNYKASILPSIEPPHPGMSYNPNYKDHQQLLKTIAEKEVKVIKQEKHLTRVTSSMFSKVTVDKRDSMWFSEMSEGLKPSVSETDRASDDGEYKAINPPAKNAKKTLQQRRKQKEQLKLKVMREAAKTEKKKTSDIHKLRALNSYIETKEELNAILREKRKQALELKKTEPKRLGSLKFEESEPEFNIGAEISGNLRNIKKEGNILTDRFKSMQKRNIIEPTIRRNRKKAKVKVFVKPEHKVDVESVIKSKAHKKL